MVSKFCHNSVAHRDWLRPQKTELISQMVLLKRLLTPPWIRTVHIFRGGINLLKPFVIMIINTRHLMAKDLLFILAMAGIYLYHNVYHFRSPLSFNGINICKKIRKKKNDAIIRKVTRKRFIGAQ